MAEAIGKEYQGYRIVRYRGASGRTYISVNWPNRRYDTMRGIIRTEQYILGDIPPHYPVPATQFPVSDLAAPADKVAFRTKWLIVQYLQHWRA